MATALAQHDVDWSQPIATLLRTGTAEAHEKAEHSEGAAWLTRGELDKEEYIRFLMMLYHVYDIFERALDRHAAHPVLAPTYNPGLFARTPSLSADVAYLLQTPESLWKTHPSHAALLTNPSASFTRYTERLQVLADSDSAVDVARLLAHAYVRYLGDLSGGQFIRRRIAKAYGLEDGAGVSFYDFKQLGGIGSSTIGDMKKIKEWYRDGMNAGVGDDVELKKAILDEANVAFELNTGLFTTLKAPSKPHSDDSASTDVVGTLGKAALVAKGDVIYEAEQRQKTYSLANVTAFVVALCLSHFVLVLGGYTGDKGYAKLEAVLHWFSNLLPVTQ